MALFDYALPPERIAQYPAEPRDAARLLILDRRAGIYRDAHVRDLAAFLRPGDCVVVNDTRVVPARLLGLIAGTVREAEVLLIRELEGGEWEALVRPARRCPVGATIILADGAARAVVTGASEIGRRRVGLHWPGRVADLLAAHGLPPLPPYIRRYRKPGGEDWSRYQTVYAAHDGAVAAPTAGLHFTPELLEALAEQGIERHAITLHVGPGTFRPVRVARLGDHRVEAERYTVPAPTARALTRARQEGRRVVAVGTTTVRALETAAGPDGSIGSGEGWTDLTITPGYRFRVVDALLTNFHLPRSSLLLLVSAFGGRQRLLDAYRHAVAAGYRFYSYGDAMLIR
ncbi:MAG: tRNA preQ1(34) S-adenosylmethionine ribosyltransferase-isomerase QueA [Candidatus Rokubacteria bacterium]|nr:tRNA preQ1(34) S-adenosylmethionine ribosyltransferase-isomerase QueA [Candidatus Rokubacteria bacterium]